MYYILPSKTASFEGETMGEKTFVYSAKRKEVEYSLKESLELLAAKDRYIDELKDEISCFVAQNFCDCGHPKCSKERTNKEALKLIDGI